MGEEKVDYSQTLNLPKTDFPMKGDLANREPQFQEFWKTEKIYQKLQEREAPRGAYVLHDGPPYANGHIHIGHALNKVLKDIVVKSRAIMGYKTPYVPGWDCHGLPIETALLKEMKMSKRGVKDIPEFRRKAAEFAERFIDLQREEFKRLGVLGDWDNPYKTLSRGYESRILRAFRLMMKKGYIYRGLKPVYWCVTCETALAEAEVEYKDKTSPSIYVAFPILKGPDVLKGAEVVIWTTTPWTLPANMAVAFHPDLEYVLVEAKGRKFLLAKARLEAVFPGANILGSWKGRDIAAQISYQRPYGKEGPGVLADYVTAEDGTGIVHTAPGHGADDFETGRKYGIEVLCPVDASGAFTDKAPEFQGKSIFKEGNPAVIADLTSRGWLLNKTDIQHSYPHCWRCKNPIIFRATEQWFLNVNHEGLREDLLKAIGSVKWIPEVGRSRISAMVGGRPDWCLSRQRVWGTPIPVLFCVGCHEPLKDDAVLEAIEKKVAQDGSDFWFANWGSDVSASEWGFLPKGTSCSKCKKDRFRRETDILDVWVDSGASWLGVLKDNGQAPADLYLEGSDQHRGWFQSSLVLSVAIEGHAPYKTVLTHGFVLDERGHAMHKSSGNVVAPQEVIQKLGADVLRLWVALADYSDDVRISDKLLEGPSDTYRRIRNTLRFLLGNTDDYRPERDAVAFEALPELERFLLHSLSVFQKATLKDYEAFEFRAAARRISDFCAFDLSSFYLDILKDRLYSLAANDPLRRAAQTVMSECLERLMILVSPILSFTAEEAWKYWKGAHAQGKPSSVFLAELSEPSGLWEDPDLADRWQKIIALRETVQKSLEGARAAKKIGSSMQAKAVLRGGGAWMDHLKVNWPEIFLTSQFDIADWEGELRVEILPAEGLKCARCWRYQRDVGFKPAHPQLCGRCAEVVSALPGRA